MPRAARIVVASLLAATALAGCGGREDAPASRGTPVPSSTPTGPTYAALADGFAVPGGSRLVSGTRTTPLAKNVAAAAWLSSGDVLLSDGRHAWVVDPGTGRRVGPSVAYGAGPVASAGRILVPAYDSRRIRVYDDELRLLRTITAPTSAMRTDQLAKDASATLGIHDPVVAGGAIWVPWYVDSENDGLTDHGVLRVGTAVTDVARNRPVVRLFPSSDGSALLVLARDRGHDVTCTGCARDDHVEAWDTRTGRSVDLGMPPGFDRWRVLEMDQVGERVVVRFAVSQGERTGSLQTWVRDDAGWSELRAQRDTATRWQGGTPLVQSFAMSQDRGDGAPYDLRYAGTTLLTRAQACTRRRPVCLTVTAPGALLPD